MKKIEFISLIDTLNIIAESTQITPFPLDSIPLTSPAYFFWNSQIIEIEEECKFSTAALLLSMAIENATPLQWWEDDGRHPRKNHSGGKIGKEILDRAINCSRIRQKERENHLATCLKDEIDPLKKSILFTVGRQTWQPGNPIGFDRSELIEFLNQNGIAHPFEYNNVEGEKEKHLPPVNNTNKRGGRPPGPFREAIEHLFVKLLNEGETDFLYPGPKNTSEFIERLRESAKDKGCHADQFIAERIDFIRKHGETYTIKTQERQVPQGKSKTKITCIAAQIKDKGDVSSILNDLRKKHSLD